MRRLLNQVLDRLARRRELRHWRAMRSRCVVLPEPQPDDRSSLQLFRNIHTRITREAQ